MALTTEDLEKAIAQTRSGLGHTLEDLGDRLTRDEMLQEALGLLLTHGGKAGSKVVSAARENPGTAAVAAAGLALLAVGGTRMLTREAPEPESTLQKLERQLAEARRNGVDGIRSARRSLSRTADRSDNLAAMLEGLLSGKSTKPRTGTPWMIGAGALAMVAAGLLLRKKDIAEEVAEAAPDVTEMLEEAVTDPAKDINPALLDAVIAALEERRKLNGASTAH